MSLSLFQGVGFNASISYLLRDTPTTAPQLFYPSSGKTSKIKLSKKGGVREGPTVLAIQNA
jgi:hypothetical protein